MCMYIYIYIYIYMYRERESLEIYVYTYIYIYIHNSDDNDYCLLVLLCDTCLYAVVAVDKQMPVAINSVLTKQMPKYGQFS